MFCLPWPKTGTIPSSTKPTSAVLFCRNRLGWHVNPLPHICFRPPQKLQYARLPKTSWLAQNSNEETLHCSDQCLTAIHIHLGFLVTWTSEESDIKWNIPKCCSLLGTTDISFLAVTINHNWSSSIGTCGHAESNCVVMIRFSILVLPDRVETCHAQDGPSPDCAQNASKQLPVAPWPWPKHGNVLSPPKSKPCYLEIIKPEIGVCQCFDHVHLIV